MDTTPVESEQPSVLLVDDVPANLLALEGVLAPLKVRLVTATSGEEALAHLLRRDDYAAILLDVQMPGLNGLETAKLIKTREKSKHIPILFITAISREAAYALRGYTEGGVDYLLKPIDPEILRAKVSVFVELYRRGEEIRRQTLAVAQSKAKDAFLAAVAHELRTPLTAAKAQAQLALRQLEDAPDRIKRGLITIERQIDRVAKFVEELFEVSRQQMGSLVLDISRFDFSELLQEVCERMQLTTARHLITYRSDRPLWLIADRDRVDQILTNLLSNAIRYSPEGGAVEVVVTSDGHHLTFEVRDEGLGVPKEKQALIFERYGRAHPADFGGMGLGLTISKGLVSLHGGDIWVESEGIPGRGSTFGVKLPVETVAKVPGGAGPSQAG
jgi:signal transduction histidine kinase